jgi:hypothetical protein
MMYVEEISEKETALDSHKSVKLIANFAIVLTTHNDEINALLGLESYNIDGEKCSKRTTEHVIQIVRHG